MADQPTTAEQDYLKAIHRPRRRRSAVSPADIASRLRVRAPSVTGMLKRLAEAGWIDYESGRGAVSRARRRRGPARHSPPSAGRTVADARAGLDWSEVDAEAEALEHAISPRWNRPSPPSWRTGGRPARPSHSHARRRPGSPSPRPLCDFHRRRPRPIREVQDDCPERLRRWRALGLTPGVVVRIVGCEPLDDLFQFEVGGKAIPMGRAGLAGLLGEPAE